MPRARDARTVRQGCLNKPTKPSSPGSAFSPPLTSTSTAAPPDDAARKYAKHARETAETGEREEGHPPTATRKGPEAAAARCGKGGA